MCTGNKCCEAKSEPLEEDKGSIANTEPQSTSVDKEEDIPENICLSEN